MSGLAGMISISGNESPITSSALALKPQIARHHRHDVVVFAALDGLVEPGDLPGDAHGLGLVRRHEGDDVLPAGEKAPHLIRLVGDHVVGREDDVGVEIFDVGAEREKEVPFPVFSSP